MLKRVISTGDSVTQITQLLAHDGEPEQVQAYYGENLDLAIPIVDTTPRIDYLFEPDSNLMEESVDANLINFNISCRPYNRSYGIGC